MAKAAFSAEAIAAALAERWEEWLDEGETFEAQVDDEGKETRVLLALVDADGTTRHEFEVKAPQQVGGRKSPVEIALDAADALVGEWLEDGRPRLTGLTTLREYEGSPVEVTMRLVRPRLDSEAERMLREDDEADEDDEGKGGFDA